MKRIWMKFFFVLLLSVLLNGCTQPAENPPPLSETEEDPSQTLSPPETVPDVPPKTELTGIRLQNAWYFPAEELAEELPGVRFSEKEGSVRASGLSASFTVGDKLLQANGRAFYSDTPAVLSQGGNLYLSAEAAKRLFGWQSSDGTLPLGQTVRFPENGEKVYDKDTLYWLSRIISAESRGEPFIGQIAVGNVVGNRVRSPLYPNTYWGVIFDKSGGVQFSPVADGSVYQTPTASSVLAAKAVLEGYTVSDSVLYFMEPNKSTSFWIPKHRTYAFTLGHHDFYR